MLSSGERFRSSSAKPICCRPVRASMIFSSASNAPPQTNRMSVVLIWMYSCCGCLRPPWGGNRGDGALQDLEQRLLHAFAGDVAGDARVLRLAGDLVDLVDVDDAPLALRHVELARLEQPHQDVLDVLADVARLGEGGGVGDGERNVQDPGERLREEGLADPGRAEEEDVRLVELDVGVPAVGGVDPLVVVVHRDGEGTLGPLLPDHVLVQRLLDLTRRGDLGYAVRDLALFIFRQDLIAECDALVADVDRRPGNEFPDGVLRFAAEGAAEVLVVGHETESPGGGWGVPER